MSIMDRAVFVSKRDIFNSKNDAFIDMVQGRMAMHVEVAIKTSVGTPHDKGQMKADTRHFKTPDGRWRVEAGKTYSEYQERGARRDGSRPVKNYTTTGTSAGWFKRAIDKVQHNKEQYIAEARKAVGL